jgi:GTP cyclohydrolase I
MVKWTWTWDDVNIAAKKIVGLIYHSVLPLKQEGVLRVYGVPRGGIPVALSVVGFLGTLFETITVQITSDPAEADVIVDDLEDSGATRRRYSAQYPVPFYTLTKKDDPSEWIEFPWEINERPGPSTDMIIRLIQSFGDDPNREGLIETPDRVLKAWADMMSGYRTDVSSLFKVFDIDSDELVLLRNVEFHSMCEHHMLPFSGVAHIGYIPQERRVIGVSKLARVLDAFSKRLQVQERLCKEIVDALDDHLKPLAVGCVIVARHHCVSCRGVGKQHSEMVTSAMRGAFRDSSSARQEFLSLIQLR